MNDLLKILFDYQRFRQNPHLAGIIAETEFRYKSLADDDRESMRSLSDDELEWINAAGELPISGKLEDGRDD